MKRSRAMLVWWGGVWLKKQWARPSGTISSKPHTVLVCGLQGRKLGNPCRGGLKGVHDTYPYYILSCSLKKAVGQLCPLSLLPWGSLAQVNIAFLGMWSCGLRHQPPELWLVGLECEVVL